MKILLVEDNPNVIDRLKEAFADIAEATVTISRSRDAGLQQLRSETFDVIVLDLKIPTKDDQLDEEVDHGVFVCTEAQRLARNTPIFVFTAFGTREIFTKRIMPLANRLDVYGDGEMSVITDIEKEALPDLITALNDINQKIAVINEVELDGHDPRPEVVSRLIRVLARRRNATLVRLNRLSGGLSGSSVWKFDLLDKQGASSLLGVAKVGTMEDLMSEKKGYESIQALRAGAYAPFVDVAQGCTGPSGAVFFRLLDHCPSDLVEVIRTSPARAAAIVTRLREIENVWVANRPTATMVASDIRRMLVSDAALESILRSYPGLAQELFEDRRISVRSCSQHGDLHAANVLVNSKDEPVLIDYGRVGLAPASLDPLTLELSIFFHPSYDALDKSWLSIKNVNNWRDLEKYANGCPYIEYLRALRDWQTHVRAGEREMFATMFSYALRQFKFDNTNKEIAAAFTAMSSAEIAKSFAG